MPNNKYIIPNTNMHYPRRFGMQLNDTTVGQELPRICNYQGYPRICNCQGDVITKVIQGYVIAKDF